jgi:N-acetylmuramoyl-L-alanine amidase
MPSYTVQQGDHLSALLEKFGFRELKTIWEHPNNAALKSERKDPHILFPGDEIFIPEKQAKTVSRPTTKLHKFQVKKEQLKLKLLLQDVNGQPRALEECKLDIDGAITTEKTGGDGTITKEIPLSAKAGRLTLSDLQVPLLIGHLDPVEKESGQIARLSNLGYEPGDVDAPDAERLRSAIEEFQCDQGLHVDGICGGSTQAKLKQVHGC